MTGVAIAPNGDIVVAGHERVTTDAGRASSVATVAAYDASGRERFRHRVGGPGASGATGLAVGADGRIAVVGRASGVTDLAPAELDASLFVEVLDARGARLWARAWPGVEREGHVAVSASGEVLIAVELEHDLDLGGGVMPVADKKFDSAVAKLDASGRHLWSRLAGGASLDAIAAAPDGGVVIAGGFTEAIELDGQRFASAGNWDGLVAKLDPRGRRSWAFRVGGDGYDRVHALALDDKGRIAAGGACSRRVDFGGQVSEVKSTQDPCVAEVDARGRVVSLRRFAEDRGSGIVHALAWANGRIAVAGRFSGIVDFGGAEPLAAYGYDVFLAELDGKRTRFSARFFTSGKTSFERQRLATDRSRIVMAGPFTEPVDFGAGELTPGNGSSVYLAGFAI